MWGFQVGAQVEDALVVVIVTPDPVTATATAHDVVFNQDIIVTPATLDVTAAIPATIVQVGVSGYVGVNVSVMSPVPHVAIQPNPVAATVVVTVNATLVYLPGSLTVQTHVETPIPRVILQPDPIDVEAELNKAIYPATIPVLAEIQPFIPRVTWTTTTLTANTQVIPPHVEIFEGKSEWYFKMISAGGQ
jgi:hypothetical protein